jgi:hypothetical protein
MQIRGEILFGEQTEEELAAKQKFFNEFEIVDCDFS